MTDTTKAQILDLARKAINTGDTGAQAHEGDLG